MLRQLQRPDGPDRVGQIVARFLTETAERVDTIRDAVRTDDPRLLEQAAHALKGIAGTVGANEVRDLGWELEQLGRTGTTVGAADLVDKLQTAVTAARPVFENLRGAA
jgi:two-component system, sensor histidine kinase and response regulator